MYIKSCRIRNKIRNELKSRIRIRQNHFRSPRLILCCFKFVVKMQLLHIVRTRFTSQKKKLKMNMSEKIWRLPMIQENLQTANLSSLTS
jgi:hypothetical protein